MFCILLVRQLEPAKFLLVKVNILSRGAPATHKGSEEVVGHVPGPERRQRGSILTSNLIALAARNPPIESLLVVKLLHQALLGQVVHAVVDFLRLPQRHVPVSEQTPVALAVQKATL